MQDLGPLSTNLSNLFNTEPVKTAVGGLSGDEGGFENIFNDALATTVTTDAIDKNSSLQLLTGEADDLSGMLIDMQKAELSLQLTLQIRNKIIDAYNEVMRMSV